MHLLFCGSIVGMQAGRWDFPYLCRLILVGGRGLNQGGTTRRNGVLSSCGCAYKLFVPGETICPPVCRLSIATVAANRDRTPLSRESIRVKCSRWLPPTNNVSVLHKNLTLTELLLMPLESTTSLQECSVNCGDRIERFCWNYAETIKCIASSRDKTDRLYCLAESSCSQPIKVVHYNNVLEYYTHDH